MLVGKYNLDFSTTFQKSFLIICLSIRVNRIAATIQFRLIKLTQNTVSLIAFTIDTYSLLFNPNRAAPGHFAVLLQDTQIIPVFSRRYRIIDKSRFYSATFVAVTTQLQYFFIVPQQSDIMQGMGTDHRDFYFRLPRKGDILPHPMTVNTKIYLYRRTGCGVHAPLPERLKYSFA